MRSPAGTGQRKPGQKWSGWEGAGTERFVTLIRSFPEHEKESRTVCRRNEGRVCMTV